MTPEGIVKKEVFDYLNAQPKIVSFNIGSRGTYDPFLKKFRAQRGQNVQKGMSDILVLVAHRDMPVTIFMEVKTKVGKLSPDQKAFAAKVVSTNGFYGVVRSAEDAKKLIEESLQRFDELVGSANIM